MKDVIVGIFREDKIVRVLKYCIQNSKIQIY